MEVKKLTPEEKNLLLQEMSARAPYGVLCYDLVWKQTPPGKIGIIDYWSKECKVYGDEPYRPIEEFRMYLRPMSSMTEEEIEFMDDNGFIVHKKTNDFDNVADVSDDGWDKNLVDKESFENVIDFLCSHHLDYRGLIEKGLALEAPNDMYKY